MSRVRVDRSLFKAAQGAKQTGWVELVDTVLPVVLVELLYNKYSVSTHWNREEHYPTTAYIQHPFGCTCVLELAIQDSGKVVSK